MRQSVVLDTNVVSFDFRSDEQYEYYRERIADMIPVIALQTYEELWFGARWDGWGRRRLAKLDKFLERFEIVKPDEEIAQECGELRVAQMRRGMTLSTADAWIAATAIVLDCPLASHDRGLASVPDLKLIQAPDARACHRLAGQFRGRPRRSIGELTFENSGEAQLCAGPVSPKNHSRQECSITTAANLTARSIEMLYLRTSVEKRTEEMQQ